jgi:hypothetical protein
MRTLFLVEKIQEGVGRWFLRLGAMWLCLLLIGLTSSVAHSAIVNNNHLYKKISGLHLKVEALAKAHKKTIQDVEAPTFSDRLPTHLYAKAIDIYDQLRRLDPNMDLPTLTLPNKTLRPRDVIGPLDQINLVLDRLLAEKMVLMIVPESEPVLGKTGSDVYQQLWWLSKLLSQLVPPPTAPETLAQLEVISEEINQITQALKLEVPNASLGKYSGKIPRDVLLVIYQNLHLLGRWERQLNVETSAPGALRSGVMTMDEVYESTRSFLADVHRMKTALSITTDVKTPELKKEASLDTLYAKAKVIHDQLRALTDAK